MDMSHIDKPMPIEILDLNAETSGHQSFATERVLNIDNGNEGTGFTSFTRMSAESDGSNEFGSGGPEGPGPLIRGIAKVFLAITLVPTIIFWEAPFKILSIIARVAGFIAMVSSIGLGMILRALRLHHGGFPRAALAIGKMWISTHKLMAVSREPREWIMDVLKS